MSTSKRRIIKVACTILRDEKHGGDINSELEERADTMLKEYIALLQNQYFLEGEVSIFLNGEKLKDPCATLGSILGDGKHQLVAVADPTISVAAGGIAFGASMVGIEGKNAVAGGGFAEGGAFEDGIFYGGRGVGGDGRGLGGNAGKAMGGTANATRGDQAMGGRAMAGRIIVNQAMSDRAIAQPTPPVPPPPPPPSPPKPLPPRRKRYFGA